ncbi:hypothetical protein BDV32DRAFT_155211 [Aspergillus pseudonomiae]|uniref:Uncharacterized protein n=1 Tax=Aspergillus pseudonomiae TaxID=1506151 RepID=A0A5N7DDV3_9EURO|nr:uncharacterized protein BDV37DRAFT_282669 [Aspergillus pseudonomiae]KAB8254450.1 hypothetical protein BDV32DRAFT_155211 [Aspergillus pseudonomiae]KAE8404630.1 hypothetical protein BDV37DRAFT_282669 [Aspergillus pseudonomiae]
MDYQERELEKQYFAEVSLTATYRGQRLVDYDTQSDGDDLDKTQRVAALVKNYIKLGILPVKVTEKYRNENYKAPGYIFSKRMYVCQKPTQQAAKETMLAHLEHLISEPATRRESRAEHRAPRRSRIDARHTSIQHRSARNADDWFTSELPWDTSRISGRDTRREQQAELPTPSRPEIDNRHTSIAHQSAHNKDDWFENELDWRNSGQ